MCKFKMNFKKFFIALLSLGLVFNNFSYVMGCPPTETSETQYIVPQGSTAISENQFSARRDLVNVYVPKSVERLSAGAFYNCLNLKSVIFEEGSNLKYIDDSVFQNCRNLETINLPDSVVYINSHCFWDCGKLPSTLALPKSLEKVEPTAFYNTKLKTVILPEQCKYQKQDYGFPYAPSFPDGCVVEGGTEFNFYSHLSVPLPPIDYTKRAIDEAESEPIPTDKFVVPEGTSTIENGQFSQRLDLVDIVIPKSVERIGASAFYGCTNLKSVRFEKGSLLKCIDYFVFQNCTSLENINIPNGLQQIRAHSFWACLKLNSISFPETLETIDANAFFMTSIRNVTLPKNCKYQVIGHGFPNETSFPEGIEVKGGIPFDFYADRPFPIKAYPTEGLKSNADVPSSKFIVPEGTTKIESTQFIGRKDLVDIVIPKSVKVICPGAFYMCCNLKSVRFEEGSELKAIEGYAFQNCHNLQHIDIPEGVMHIRAHAFWCCAQLKDISIPASMKIIDASTFYTSGLTSVSLPATCKYQGVRHGFPHELSFPKNCAVVGGVPCDLYYGV